MPTGSASFSSGRLKPVTALMLPMKKSAYLNKPSRLRLTTTDTISQNFFHRCCAAFPMARPQR